MNNTEILDLSGDCTASLPNYPKELDGATGQFLDDKIIICGGGFFLGVLGNYSDCFILRKGESSFESFPSMKEARIQAKSVVTQGRIWVTGGIQFYGLNYTILSSTEYIPNNSSNEPILPEPLCYHAIISINDTTSMLIGGVTNGNDLPSSKTHYFNHLSQTWKSGPRLMNGRFSHSAGIIMDHATHEQHIAVVGGTLESDMNTSSDSVELLLNGETQWTEGI